MKCFSASLFFNKDELSREAKLLTNREGARQTIAETERVFSYFLEILYKAFLFEATKKVTPVTESVSE